MSKIRLIIILTILIGCSKPDMRIPLQSKVIGTYTGFLNYVENPIGGGNIVQPVTFNIARYGLTNIKITTKFDLVINVSRTFTASYSGSEIITLGEGDNTKYNSNGIEISCGGTNFNNWGQMCGYYDVSSKSLTISFAWTDGTKGGSGFLFANRLP